MKKRGQVTLFLIIAILIIAGIFIYFFWGNPLRSSRSTQLEGFQGCVADAVKEVLPSIEKNAGYIDPEFTYKYQDQDIPYLCYTNQYYALCVVQQPLLYNHFKKSIKKAITPQVNDCYKNSLDELQARGFTVVSGTPETEIFFEPTQIKVQINAPTTAGTSQFKKFTVKIPSPLYDMISLTTTLVQSEAVYGDADTPSLTLLYPDYAIQKTVQGEGTTLYFLRNRKTKDEIDFASRSLVFPAGYGKNL